MDKYKKRFNKLVLSFRQKGISGIISLFYNFIKRRIYPQDIASNYKKWIQSVESKIVEIKLSKITNKEFKTKISIVMPVYNTPSNLLIEAIESITSQTYSNWELCIYDDASTKSETINTLKRFENSDDRIKIKYGKENGHISHSTNEALKNATGEYVLFMDHDDLIPAHALAFIAEEIEKSNPDIIYYDEDIISEYGERLFPILKTDFAPDTLLSVMYMAHATYKRNLVEKLGGMRKGYEGSQDYDLVLRATDDQNLNIKHLPFILYHWRSIPGSTASDYSEKNYARTASLKALEDTVVRRNLNAKLEQGNKPYTFRIKYNIENNPKVSIIIPTKNQVRLLKKCIDSIETKTIYKNYEIIIIDNNSDDSETLEYLANSKHKVIKYSKPFNYSAINNFGVENASGDHIILLNNDVEIINPEWMSAMLEFSQQEKVGAVGALLLYDNDSYQHVGLVLGIGGSAGHMYKGVNKNENGILDRCRTISNVQAVTAACLMIKKSLYQEISGLDENLAVSFNDVDFCIKLLDKGYKNIYTPYAELYHYESRTRGYDLSAEKLERLEKEKQYLHNKWKDKYFNYDPYYNINLSYETEIMDYNWNLPQKFINED